MITPIQELQSKSDAYISDMLANQEGHSPEYLQAATLIYEERNLSDPQKQLVIKQYPALEKEATAKLISGELKESVFKYLQIKGVSAADAHAMIKSGLAKAEEDKIEKATSKKKFWISAAIGFVVGLLIALLLKKCG